jgi:hypothetical protein
MNEESFLRKRGWELLPSGWWMKILPNGRLAKTQEGALAYEGWRTQQQHNKALHTDNLQRRSTPVLI